MRRAVIATPVISAEALAAMCVVAHIDALVISHQSGTLVVIDLPERKTPTDWDISELLPDANFSSDAAAPTDSAPAASAEQPAAEQPTGAKPTGDSQTVDPEEKVGIDPDTERPEVYAAATLSRAATDGVVLFISQVGEDVGVEHGISGHVSAQRFVDGKPGEELPAGVLIAQSSETLEEIILGLRDPGAEESVIDTSTMSRLDALRAFKSAMRPFPGGPASGPGGPGGVSGGGSGV